MHGRFEAGGMMAGHEDGRSREGPGDRAAELRGKVAIVTGSGQSLGAAIARLLARQGAAVVVNSRREENSDGSPTARDVAREILSDGGVAVPIFADVATSKGAAQLVTAADREFGRVDIVVNNVGLADFGTVASMGEQQWDTVLAANLRSVYLVSHLASSHLSQSPSGRLINVSSRVGIYGSAGMSAYAAAKAGVIGFTLSLAKEWQDTPQTANCILPTHNSPRAASASARRESMGGRSFGRSAERSPSRVAPVAAYLAGPHAGDISGQVFYASAGLVELYAVAEPRVRLTEAGELSVGVLEEQRSKKLPAPLGPPTSSPPPGKT